MKRTTRWLAGCLALCMTAALLVMPTVAEEASNMIRNGDFSRGNLSWNTWSSNSTAGTFEIVRDGGPDGSPCMKITNTTPVASSLFQNVACKKGAKYIMTCDVKYENVSLADGSLGVCIGSALYNAAGENIRESLSSPAYGTSEWRTISYVFELDQDPARFAIGPRLWASSGTLYVDNISLYAISDVPAQSSTYNLVLSDTANRHTVNALGAEWDPKLFLPVNAAHGVTEDDLDVIKNAIKTLGLQAVRMMVTPDWFEKENDNDDPSSANADGFDFDNAEMKSLFAYLRVCEELGVRVTLTWWGAPTGHWLALENTGDWIGAPNSLDEATENIAYLLGYIRNELKYTCVKELILQNEPSYSFKVNGGAVDFNYYVEFYKAMQARLQADGMSDIVLVGADDAQHYGWYTQSYEGLKDICGKFDSHNYAWSYDLPYLDVLIQEFVSARTSISGDKPFFLGEFGDGSTEGAYTAASTETFGRGIYVASVIVNAFKAGAAGASYWPLHDIYYYENTEGGDNGGLMAQGLIGFKKDGAWSYRPTYYAYGLLCNFIPFGSEIYDVQGNTDHYVDTVAVKTAEGRWSIIAVNRSDAAQTLIVKADAIGTMMNLYTYADGELPTDGSMIAAQAQRVQPEASDGYRFTVPAESFVVLSNIDMTEKEMAIPETETSESSSESNTDIENGTEAEEKTETTTDPADSGCASLLGGAAVLAALPATALLYRRKRNERDES